MFSFPRRVSRRNFASVEGGNTWCTRPVSCPILSRILTSICQNGQVNTGLDTTIDAVHQSGSRSRTGPAGLQNSDYRESRSHFGSIRHDRLLRQRHTQIGRFSSAETHQDPVFQQQSHSQNSGRSGAMRAESRVSDADGKHDTGTGRSGAAGPTEEPPKLVPTAKSSIGQATVQGIRRLQISTVEIAGFQKDQAERARRGDRVFPQQEGQRDGQGNSEEGKVADPRRRTSGQAHEQSRGKSQDSRGHLRSFLPRGSSEAQQTLAIGTRAGRRKTPKWHFKTRSDGGGRRLSLIVV